MPRAWRCGQEGKFHRVMWTVPMARFHTHRNLIFRLSFVLPGDIFQPCNGKQAVQGRRAPARARREALSAKCRHVGGRRTTSPCPTRDEVLDAWTHRHDSHEAAVRFGSMVHDLECYLDNSLLRDGNGEIVGRRGGVKAWLQVNIPALYVRYTTVMRYKAMAKRLRQVVGLADPVPAEAVLAEPPQGGAGAEKRDYGSDSVGSVPLGRFHGDARYEGDRPRGGRIITHNILKFRGWRLLMVLQPFAGRVGSVPLGQLKAGRPKILRNFPNAGRQSAAPPAPSATSRSPCGASLVEARASCARNASFAGEALENFRVVLCLAFVNVERRRL